MFEWISQNLGSLIAGAAVVALLAAVTVKLVKDKKARKGSCGCGCSGCPNAGLCHKG